MEHLWRVPKSFTEGDTGSPPGVRAPSMGHPPPVVSSQSSIKPILGKILTDFSTPFTICVVHLVASRRSFNRPRDDCYRRFPTAPRLFSIRGTRRSRGGERDRCPRSDFRNPDTILCGGSLGSCVDEERSQLR